MPINGIIAKKLELLREQVKLLHAWSGGGLAALQADELRQRAIERTLQVSVEIMIDVSQRLLAVIGDLPAEQAGENFRKLEQAGVIQAAAAYADMVKFRNFIVHCYDRVDIAILHDLTQRRLSDFDRFGEEIQRYCETH